MIFFLIPYFIYLVLCIEFLYVFYFQDCFVFLRQKIFLQLFSFFYYAFMSVSFLLTMKKPHQFLQIYQKIYLEHLFRKFYFQVCNKNQWLVAQPLQVFAQKCSPIFPIVTEIRRGATMDIELVASNSLRLCCLFFLIFQLHILITSPG